MLAFLSSSAFAFHCLCLQVLLAAEGGQAAQHAALQLRVMQRFVWGLPGGLLPISSTAEQTEDGFYFSEHIGSFSTV